MLIVVSIMMLLVGAAAAVMRPASESRRVREAAREISVYLSSARNRAMETGRPCGVMLRRLQGADTAVLTLDQCEVPPCYAGDTTQSMATVTCTDNTIFAQLANSDTPINLLREGDLIQFNSQGPFFAITRPNNVSDTSSPHFGYIHFDTVPWQLECTKANDVLVPWDTNPKQATYRIIRSPIKGAALPLELPASTVIDLAGSGTDTVLFNGGDWKATVIIIFSPNGSIDRVYYNNTVGIPTEPIFLLVGKRERIGNGFVATPTSANEPDWPNYQDLNNLWIVIHPQTGLVTTSEVAASAGAPDEATAIALSRDFARDAQSMGGK